MLFPTESCIAPQVFQLRVHLIEVVLDHRLRRCFSRLQATAGIADSGGRSSYKADNIVTMVKKPEKNHQRQKVAQVERWCGGVYAGIEATFSRTEEFVQRDTVTVRESILCSETARPRVFGKLPGDLVDISSSVEHVQHTLICVFGSFRGAEEPRRGRSTSCRLVSSTS